MQKINRNVIEIIKKRILSNPVVAILGARQCGKSTVAKFILNDDPDCIYLDLEKESDQAKLNDVWAFFNANRGKLICLDEIQLKPEIFTQIRSFVDEQDTNGQFLILGSASRDIIKQSSESLAGRIAYIEMTPFLRDELFSQYKIKDMHLQGGFPRSILALDLDESFIWRENFIKSFLERDLPQLGFRIPSSILNRFWRICAHVQGQLVNASKLGTSLGVTHHTIKNYLYLLEETFMIRLLNPYHANLKKRLVKSPKMYIRDSGIVHALLQIETYNELLGHPVYGFSFEGFVIENLINHHPKHEPFFYRTAAGDEIDLLLIKGQEILAFEIKSSSSPQLEKGFWNCLRDIQPSKACIIAQVNSPYPYKDDILVYDLDSYLKNQHPTIN